MYKLSHSIKRAAPSTTSINCKRLSTYTHTHTHVHTHTHSHTHSHKHKHISTRHQHSENKPCVPLLPSFMHVCRPALQTYADARVQARLDSAPGGVSSGGGRSFPLAYDRSLSSGTPLSNTTSTPLSTQLFLTILGHVCLCLCLSLSLSLSLSLCISLSFLPLSHMEIPEARAQVDERRIQRARPFIAALHTTREEKTTVPRTQVCFYPTLLEEEDTSIVTVTLSRKLLTRKRIWVSPNLLTRSRVYSFLISLGIRSERARLSGGVRLCAKMLDGAPVNLCFRCLPSTPAIVWCCQWPTLIS
jgi:hypothetical protein